MTKPYVTVVLISGLLLAGTLLLAGVSRQHWPDNHQGYMPPQPIAFSHRMHADELLIDCQYCHSSAAESRHAGLPTGDVCMRCHKFVTASFDAMQAAVREADEEPGKADAETNQADQGPSKTVPVISEKLLPLYQAMAFDVVEMKPKEGQSPEAIRWKRVHNLPDYVYFDHRAHVNAGVTCQYCHGPVESMQTVQQFASLSMGWCVNCHRDAAKHGVQGRPANPSTDCAACHY